MGGNVPPGIEKGAHSEAPEGLRSIALQKREKGGFTDAGARL
jgi:hypothetical protein